MKYSLIDPANLHVFGGSRRHQKMRKDAIQGCVNLWGTSMSFLPVTCDAARGLQYPKETSKRCTKNRCTSLVPESNSWPLHQELTTRISRWISQLQSHQRNPAVHCYLPARYSPILVPAVPDVILIWRLYLPGVEPGTSNAFYLRTSQLDQTSSSLMKHSRRTGTYTDQRPWNPGFDSREIWSSD